MLTLTLLIGLIAGPTSSPAVADIAGPVAARSGPTLHALRVGASPVDASNYRTVPTVLAGPRRQAALGGAVLGGLVAFGISSSFAGDSDSTGGGVGTVVAATLSGALIGFVLVSLIAGPE